jgi:hypothetical protein
MTWKGLFMETVISMQHLCRNRFRDYPLGRTQSCHIVVTGFVNENMPERWIGSDDPKAWPPKSPDLTHVDFFLWGWARMQSVGWIRVLFRRCQDYVEHLEADKRTFLSYYLQLCNICFCFLFGLFMIIFGRVFLL